MTRIVAGHAGGRRLTVPGGSGTRPTSDRAREALFSMLESVRGPLTGARVLDLYAGSGALGLEALSRGAGQVLLVEADAHAVAVLRENVDAVGLPGAEVRRSRVERLLRQPPTRAYDVVFADPPYAEPAGAVTAMLGGLAAGWLAADGLVVVERSARAGFAWPPGYTAVRDRRYGEAHLYVGGRDGSW